MICEFEKTETGIKCKNCGFSTNVQIEGMIVRHCPMKGQQSPSFFEKVANFAEALIDHAKTGFENVSEEEKNKRMEICKTCDKFDKSTETCNLCGCHCNRKTAWKSSECPLKKW